MSRKRRNQFLLVACLAWALGFRLQAQTFKTLHNFSGGVDQGHPYAPPVVSGDTLYGTAFITEAGFGTVFALKTNGSNFTNLYHFTLDDGDGAGPMAGLVLASDTLYGTTAFSGGDGTIFAISTNGTNYRTLHSSLNGGTMPQAGLILIGGTLYGTTTKSEGGDGYGTVFKINTDGSGYTVLYNFTGGGDGAFPSAGLVASGNTLFGTASQGGVGDGTVFAINIDGTGFTVLRRLHQFSGDEGGDPQADLVLSSSRLYGTTIGGGSRGNGTVFAMNIDGTDFKTLHSFGSTTEDGGSPHCPLTLSGNALYGTTQGGGSSGSGTIFRINTDGTAYRTIYNFSSLKFVNIDLSTNADGAYPRAGLVLSGNALYGTASAGGNFGAGSVFSVSLEPVITASPIITSSQANIILSWSTNVAGLTLQSTTSLSLPVWTTVSPGPGVINGQNTVTNPISGAHQFFRLSE